MRLIVVAMIGLALLLLAWTLSSCEPCAVVLTGHCEERQHDEEKPGGTVLEPPAAPEPLYVPRGRG